MKKLKGKNLLLVGFTLFSMFFGAGNLIFPPSISAQAGTMTWFAMIGLTLSAVCLPVLGVVAVARSGGLTTMGSRVHPVFATVYTIAAYLAIGPCLAIPRTCSTSFEMAIPPFVGPDAPIWLFQLIYTVVFFGGALIMALRPEKLTDRLGKIMCPILIVLITVTFAGCLIHPLGGYGAPAAGYETPVTAVASGFLEGYQTMDTIAALVFGIVISLNIRARGIEDEDAVVKGTVQSGFIAGVMLFIVYSMLAHVGALSGNAYPGASNGAVILTNLIGGLFGTFGNVILGAIFVIACFNVCVGLICSCGEYFTSVFPKITYRTWTVIFALVSAVLANAGLDKILAISVPVLNIIYPVAIVMIAMALFQKHLEGKKLVYPVTVLFTGVVSILFEVQNLTHTEFMNFIPLSDLGLGWMLPAVLGFVLGFILSNSGEGREKGSRPSRGCG